MTLVRQVGTVPVILVNTSGDVAVDRPVSDGSTALLATGVV